KKIAKEIQKHFPPHKIYIEPFFGAGGMFFNKPKAKYNIVNDLDSDVFNLFQVVMNQKEELEKAFYIIPIHSDLLEYWKKKQETEPIKKALRFLFLSLFMPFGHQGTIDLNPRNAKNRFYDVIDKTNELLFNVKFSNIDCCLFINAVCKRIKSDGSSLNDAFIYNDPPYLGTTDNYSNSFTEEQSKELFDTLEQTKCKWAMSEFNHPFILDQAEKRGLNIITIGERQNLKNRRTEILITNYENRQQTLF
ncbi:MAG: DNA adenine methylase, partial [Mesoflavibacter sp.]|nr:DNA adenine methylase [Mesoflavibacter sp.]